MPTEQRLNAVVSWSNSPHHRYEDRYRLLSRDISLVAQAGIGELYGVFDGIGGAPLGMSAAQAMADCLISFLREPLDHATLLGLSSCLHDANREINSWGMMEGTDRPLGGCAGTVAWIHDHQLTLFHAGDTVAMLLRPGETPRTLTTVHQVQGCLIRYFGLGDALQMDKVELQLQADDMILLMSDGVTKAFSPKDAANLLLDAYNRTGALFESVAALVDRCRRKGSTDDITALVVDIGDELPS